MGAWGGHALPICSVEAPVIPIKEGQVPLGIIYTIILLYRLKDYKNLANKVNFIQLGGSLFLLSPFTEQLEPFFEFPLAHVALFD